MQDYLWLTSKRVEGNPQQKRAELKKEIEKVLDPVYLKCWLKRILQ